LSKRRGQNEDSVYWDESKNLWVGAVSLGFDPSGTRRRRKVTGRTKTEVREKLRNCTSRSRTGYGPSGATP